VDCIGEISAICQGKLLRVLQDGAFRPLGGYTETSVDVRVIAATNRDLVREMEAGRFREDLYYRIAVLPINTPPLRECPSDIPLLVDHFLHHAQERFGRSGNHMIELNAIAALASYTWPGNVRQLRNLIERLVASSADGVTITEHDIYTALATATLTNAKAELPIIHDDDSLDAILDRTMLRVYDQVLAKTGSHTLAAKTLHTDRVSLYQRIKRARRRLWLTKSF
jgi:transcriptional regulator with PAS, ATPase and Fis domain